VNEFDSLERRLPEILTDLSAPHVPDYFDDILARSVSLRQRPSWGALERWLPMELVDRAPVAVRGVPWRMVALVALLVLGLVAAVAFVGSRRDGLPAPFGTAANGSLVYERDGDLYAADPTTGTSTLLVSGEENDFAPIWSRDGRTIAFLRAFGESRVLLMAADADGTNVRQLGGSFASFESLDWSPDGSRLAIVDEGGLSILRTDGTGGMRGISLGITVSAAMWRAPLGAELVLLGSSGNHDLALYAVRPDGTGLRTIVLHTDESDPHIQHPQRLTFQSLSLTPDGREAVFWNWEPGVEPGHCCSIHRIDLDTGKDARMDLKTAQAEIRPVLSPDGRSIVFEGQAANGDAHLFVAPLDGIGSSRVIGPGYYYGQDHEFALSPDGAKVILVLDRRTSVIDVATGDTVVVDAPGLPSWQRLAP
jgi:Tol biopolymer transport system component